MNSYITAHINHAAFQHNLALIKQKVGDAKILAIIKSNGYGHGLLRAAASLQQADAFGVARIDEAAELRAAGITHPITVFSSFANKNELQDLSRLNLDTVIFNFKQLELFCTQPLENPLTIWLKIDTGMHRLGFPPEEIGRAYQALHNCKNLREPIRFLTQLACADEPTDAHNQQQIQCFNKFINWNGARSIANSAALFAFPETHMEWVRPGISLYGISPFAEKTGSDLGLRPVMTLQTKLIGINKISKGESIGYGASWTCPEDMLIGVAAIGYGDGYPRNARDGTPILVGDKICPLVGRVSMNLVMIDLGNNPNAQLGDPVILWGEKLPVEIIAKWSDTISYELLCRVSPRMEFVES